MAAVSSSKMKSNPSSGAGNRDIVEQEVVQAVVVCDSFNVRFAPLTDEKPRVLLPLVNRPVIEYTLEFLRNSGIQEAYLFCCSQSHLIKDYIQNSKWSSPCCPMTVTVISSETYLSFGDVLRELYAKELIRNDFILLTGDIVANIPILDILEKHKKQRKVDKGLVMTMIFHTALPGHRSRCREDETFLAVDSFSNKILHFQKCGGEQKLSCPLSVLQENSETTIRYDLLDTHISICSNLVPSLFADNFDFQTRDDFVRGILVNEEILRNSIYLHAVEDGYAARLSNLFMYDAISRDIVERWVSPVTLETQNDCYTYYRHNIYTHQDVELERGCTLEKNAVIGKGTKIGSNTKIIDSVIGRNCCIGDNVHIEGAYIWDNVEIGNKCRLKTCLLADGVVLKPNVFVSPGCVLSYKVIIGPDIELKENTHLQAKLPNDGYGDEDVTADDGASCDPKIVGKEGVGYVCGPSLESDEELPLEATHCNIWGCPVPSDDDGFSSSDESSLDEASPAASPVPDDQKMFYNEVLDSLQRGWKEKIKCENLILEINSSKYAYNVTMKELNMLVVKAILEIPPQTGNYLKELRSLLLFLLPLLKNYIKSEESQMDCLMSLEEYSMNQSSFATCLSKVVFLLYEKDVLAEDVIMKWYRNPPAMMGHDLAEQNDIRKHVVSLIKWFEEAEEESADESD